MANRIVNLQVPFIPFDSQFHDQTEFNFVLSLTGLAKQSNGLAEMNLHW